MPRIKAIDPATASGRSKELLNRVQAKLGATPNLMRTLAHSPAALESYLSSSEALSGGALPAPFREQIAILVAQLDGCEYCLSAHSFLGLRAGLDAAEIDATRRGQSADPKIAAGLRFAREVVAERGSVSSDSTDRLHKAGYSDAEVIELIAHVALNIFTNYLNVIAGTEVDFPRVALESSAATESRG